MKIALSVKVPVNYDYAHYAQIVREIEHAVNILAEERLAGKYGASTSAPTTGSWAQGDFVRNSAPAEAGSASSKYVIYGWRCVTSGTPGTWVEQRALTGN